LSLKNSSVPVPILDTRNSNISDPVCFSVSNMWDRRALVLNAENAELIIVYIHSDYVFDIEQNRELTIKLSNNCAMTFKRPLPISPTSTSKKVDTNSLYKVCGDKI
jgi:hypothetical protein